MKKILFSLILLITTMSMMAQTSPATNMALRVVVNDMDAPFPPASKTQLENKLTQLLTKNGVVTTDWQNQFVITVVAVPQTKDIIPGAPTQFAQTLDFTFYIADTYNQLVFSSANLSAKGVAESEAKSFIEAIKHINIGSSKLSGFVEEGKQKVIHYYNTQAPVIFKKVDALVAQKQFEEALYLLAAIPSESDFFVQANEKGITVFRAYLLEECNRNLAAAKMAWAAEQNTFGAEKAGAYLKLITPDMGCYEEATNLYLEIKKKVLDDWHFEMKIYQDQVDLERERIQAWREVGVAYGQNQKPSTTFLNWPRS